MPNTDRKRLRLEGYDYRTEGVYYITVCTANKEKTLCSISPPEIEGDYPKILLTPLGRIVEEAIKRIPGIDKYAVMPNHVHMILFQNGEKTISTKIRLWKSVIARQTKCSIWQSHFYDHIIRDEADYRVKWKYIDENPIKWASGEFIGIQEEDIAFHRNPQP